MENEDGTQAESLLTEAERRESSEDHAEFNGASFSGAVFNLATTIIGAGLMALPATMKILGLFLGVAMILAMAFVTNASVEFLLRFSTTGNIRSYGALMEESFGRPGRIMLQLAVLVSNIGSLIVYMIIIGDVLAGKNANGIHLAGMFQGWFGEMWWNRKTIVLLFTTLFVLAPLTCYKRIDSLRFTSAIAFGLAVVFLFITAGIVTIKLFTDGLVMPRLLPNVTDLPSFWNLFTVVPVLVNAYVCHAIVHSIQNELQDATQIRPVVRSALTLCSLVFLMTSLFGYLLFGESTLDDVLANFNTDLGLPLGSFLSDAVRLSYAAHLMLVFPIVFYPLRVSIDGLFFPSAPPLAASNLRFASITATLIVLIFLGANFIPNIWDAFQFTGATASVCLGFIFPAAVVLTDRHNQATNRDKTIAIFMIVLAFFSNAIALYSDACALFNKVKSIFAI